MAGTVNKSKKTGERLLLRPSEGAQWEVWAMGNGSHARLVETCDTPADARISPQSVLALPLRQSFAVPLWLATTDPALMREMIFLQLERRGLATGRTPREMVFDYRVISAVENKTLALAVALPGALPANLCLDLRAHEPSARFLPLPRDEFTLWRENGRLALAVTRGEELVYFQALGDGHFTGPVLRELQCIKLQLEAENAIQHPQGITLWGDFAAGETASLGEAMDMRVTNAPRPSPALPREWMDLTPASVRQTQHAAKGRERSALMMAAAAGLYLLLLLCLVLSVTLSYIRGRQMEEGLKAHRTEVADIEATVERWRALSPAIDPESYPVELLLHCSQPPPEGVRFTFFGAGSGKILIQGETGNAKAAFKFAEDLKHRDGLQDYKFDMPLPATLPNGNAKFQIEGVQYGANSH